MEDKKGSASDTRRIEEPRYTKMPVNILTCALCLERFRCPKLLPCFHTFCLKCLQALVGTKSSFACPTCRATTVLPPGGAADLQANFYLEKDLAKSDSQDVRECELCSKGKQARFKCLQCQQVSCPSCQNTHGAIQSCALHTVITLVEDGARKSVTRDEKKCAKHINQRLLLFCRQCQVSICMQCKLTSHDGHETEDVVDTGERARAELRKEQLSLAQRERTLEAMLDRSEGFRQELAEEKETAERDIIARAKEVKAMVLQAQKEALRSVTNVAEKAFVDLQKQAVPIKERHSALVAKRQHLERIIEKGDDDEAVTVLAQIKTEMEQMKRNKSSKLRDEVMVERNTIYHECKSRAVKYADVLAFVGLARDGPVMEAKATSLEAAALQESVKPRNQEPVDSQLTFPRHRMSKTGSESFVEVVYSRNPVSTLLAMHLTSDDSIWVLFNPGANVPLLALFDDDGKRTEIRYENVPSSGFLVTCEGDTTVCLIDGKWFRPDGENGSLENYTSRAPGLISKSASPFLLQTTSIFNFTSLGIPPEVNQNPIHTTNVGSTLGFDVSADGKFFAFAHANFAYIKDRIIGTTALRNYAHYTEPNGSPVSDVCFCVINGEELLLVALTALNSVHVIDHKDGGCFVRTLEADQYPLTSPCRLTTNHQGRIWVGCNGGKVIIFDV